MSMEEGFFLDGVALNAADIAPGHIECPAPVVANLANAGLPVRDLATVSAGKTPHPVAVELFVEFALSNVFMNDFAQLRSEEHTSELQSPDHLVCRLL